MINIIKDLSDGKVVSYSVIPITANSGLVEIVSNCTTLTRIYRNGTVRKYLESHLPKGLELADHIQRDEILKAVLRKYKYSLAYYTIITYIFGVGDRHFDNIMLCESGDLFHVDYGFILGSDPKIFHPKVRLNTYMLEGIDDNEFKELCFEIFNDLRGKVGQIYTLMLCLPDVNKDLIKEHLRKVFFLGEVNVKGKLEFMIDNSRDSVSGGFNDYAHTLSKKTSGMMSYFYG